MRNPAFMVTAALTHACQMVELLAFYLDVNLPKRINYSEFCQLELSKRDFRSAVDRLNSNVLHLCFTQVGKIITDTSNFEKKNSQARRLLS